jgi:hypothetical protein
MLVLRNSEQILKIAKFHHLSISTKTTRIGTCASSAKHYNNAR